jgi:predicted nucleic acid-binding protein
MKIFLDANILVTVLNKEYPSYQHCARILSLPAPKYRICTSPVCLAIAFYFAEKKSRTTAKKKISLLCENIEITPVGHNTVRSALSNPSAHDLEDGIEYYSAVEAGCQCIVTDNTKDFYFADIEVLASLDFYSKYMARKA